MRRLHAFAPLPLAGCALLLAGCALGPNYTKPPVPPSAAAPFASAPAEATTAAAAADSWWRLYEDPLLDTLIGQAFAANTDLRVATANLRRARASLSESRTARLPQTIASASATQQRAVILLPGGAANFTTDFYRLGLDATYELDLYGRVGRSIEAARADAAAEAAARDTVLVSVAAETARAYADACSASAQLAVATRSLTLQSDSFALTERRVASGRDAPLDLARAQAQLETTRASLPAFAAARRAALFRLAVLTGKPPTEVDPRAAACTTPPKLSQPIPTGDGAALLLRRPDVRAADRRLAAATARIGVAKADYFPRINLGGTLSGQGVDPGDVISTTGFGFSVGPSISWSFPNFAAVAARTRQARATTEAAVATFDGTILAALQETETALSDYAGVIERNRALTRASERSGEAARIIRLRYRAGRDSFLAVLDAERTLAAADADLAASNAALTTAQIAVFKALGGGWQTPPAS